MAKSIVVENRKMRCWKCGEREATEELYGYPVCAECAEEGIDPEEMELVVIDSLKEGAIVPLDAIKCDGKDDDK